MPPEVPSFGAMLIQTLVSLGLVCALAFVAIRFGLARWMQRRDEGPQHLEVVSSLPLGPRRTLYLVRAVDEVLVVGASEAGLQPLGKLDPQALGKLQSATGPDATSASEPDKDSSDPGSERVLS